MNRERTALLSVGVPAGSMRAVQTSRACPERDSTGGAESGQAPKERTVIISAVFRRGAMRGQSIIETAVLLGAIVAALVVFSAFIRSAVSSRIKIGSDAFGHGMLFNGP